MDCWWFELLCPPLTLLLAVRLAFDSMGVIGAYVIGFMALYVLISYWYFSFRRPANTGWSESFLFRSTTSYEPPFLTLLRSDEVATSSRCFRLFFPLFMLLLGMIAWRRELDIWAYVVSFLDLDVLLAYGFSCNQWILAATMIKRLWCWISAAFVRFCAINHCHVSRMRQALDRLKHCLRAAFSSFSGIICSCFCQMRQAIDRSAPTSSATTASSRPPAESEAISSSGSSTTVSGECPEPSDRIICIREEQCTICLESVQGDRPVWQLPACNHPFHVDCIGTWFQSHSTCPVCRTSVDPDPEDRQPERPVIAATVA